MISLRNTPKHFAIAAGVLLTVTALSQTFEEFAATRGEDSSFALREPSALDFDAEGNLYVVHRGGCQALKVLPDGSQSVFAGDGEPGFSGDGGPAVQARFRGIGGIAAAPGGDLYIADSGNYRIRKVDGKSGIVSTVAGIGEAGFGGDDGPAIEARLGSIRGLIYDAARNSILLADADNYRLRAVNLDTLIIQTLAGNGERGAPQDRAPAAESPIGDVSAMALDEMGRLYFLECEARAVRVMGPGGNIRTVMDAAVFGQTEPPIIQPTDLCLGPNNNLYIVDAEGRRIFRFLASQGRLEVFADGAEGSGLLDSPRAIRWRPGAGLFIADFGAHRLLRVHGFDAAEEK